MSDEPAARLTVAFAPGVQPAKWFRRWRERYAIELVEVPDDDPAALVRCGRADMALARDPEPDDSLHRIDLYDEAPGVAVERDHPAAVLPGGEPIDAAEFDGDVVLLASADPVSVREMLPVVATGAGILYAPRPLLRILGGKAIVDREVRGDGAAAPTGIALVWPKAADDDVRQDFAGVVRGRRAGTTRDSGAGRKRTAREKALAKQARRIKAAGGKGKSATPSGGRRSGRKGGQGGAGGAGGVRGKRNGQRGQR